MSKQILTAVSLIGILLILVAVSFGAIEFKLEYDEWKDAVPEEDQSFSESFVRMILQLGLNLANKFICFYAIYLTVLTVLKLIQVSACNTFLNMTLSFFDLMLIIPQALLFILMPSVLTWILLVASVVPTVCDVVFYVAEY